MPETDIRGEGSKFQITRHGAMAVVLSDDRRRVLLLRREIFVLWDLPGGGIEPGEEPATAAIRECCEETGYSIAIERQVGLYRHPSVYGRGYQLTHVFLAHATGGIPKRFGLEITGLRWCAVTDFPRGLQPLQKQMIADALLDSPKIRERHLEFPLWQLYPARVAFFIVNLTSRIVRWFL